MKVWSKRSACPIVVLLALAGADVAAQTQANDLQRQVEDAFRQVLSAPGNLDTGYRYARLLVEAGNFEGGIAALERLLLDPTSSPTIRLELAVLYYRLGSYEIAQSYAGAAAEDSALEPALRADAARLATDAARRTETHQLSGAVTVGLRGQSNPTTAPDSPFIRSLGATVPRPANIGPRTDVDAQLAGRAEHVWDFERTDSAALVSTVAGFANRFFDGAAYNTRAGKTDALDIVVLETTSGIRFKPAPEDAAGLSLRPYLVLSDVLLVGRQFSLAWGAGLDLGYRLEDGRSQLDATYEARRNIHAPRADVAEAGKQGGPEQILRLRGSREIAAGQQIVVEGTLRDHATDRSYFDYRSGELRLSFVASHANPLGWDERSWTSSLYGGATRRRYGGPDPQVSPGTTRSDVEWRTGAWVMAPIGDSWSLLLQAEYVKADSNLVNYDYDNLVGLIGAVWRF